MDMYRFIRHWIRSGIIPAKNNEHLLILLLTTTICASACVIDLFYYYVISITLLYSIITQRTFKHKVTDATVDIHIDIEHHCQ